MAWGCRRGFPRLGALEKPLAIPAGIGYPKGTGGGRAGRRKGELAVGWYSIKAKIAAGVAAVLLMVTAALAVNTVQASRAVRAQAVSSYRTTGAAIMEQIDFQLEGADNHLHALTASDYNLRIIRNSLNVDEVTFANVRFQSALSTTLSANQLVGSFFLYDGEQGRYWDVYNPSSTYEERERVRRFLRAGLGGPEGPQAQSMRWQTWEIGGDSYLLDIKQYGKLYLGAWVSADTLYDSLGVDGGGVSFLLVSDKGAPMAGGWEGMDLPALDYGGGGAVLDRGDELLVGSHSSQGGFSLVVRLSDRELLEGLPRWYHFVLIALACVAALLPAVAAFFHYTIAKPMDSMVRGLRRFGEGDADARMALRPEEGEFCLLKREFNQMADQIKTLRLDVYEEALERQKAELQYLEMQINPHFFLNALNGIYAFAVANNVEMVRRMILLLSGYLRRSFQRSFAVIPLRDELEHTRRYLEIQQIRFQDRISAEVDIPGFLLDAPVPALCLHTFVDNAIKHQTSGLGGLRITVSARMAPEGGVPFLRLRVRDDGEGFSPQALAAVRAGEAPADPGGGLHVGIWNFRRRLDILYRGKARLAISNVEPHGAAVDVWVPAPQEGGGDG